MEMNESNNMGSLNFVQLVRDGLIDHAGIYSQVKGWSKRAIETLLDDMRNEAFGIQMFENTGANQPKIQRLADMIDFIATEFFPNYDYYRKTTARDKQENTEHKEKRKYTAAAKMLESQRLQEVKQGLVNAGLIVDGRWEGTPAEFGCLVLELFEQYKVATNGGRAWTACKNWAGYEDSMKSARNAIDANPNTRGDNAETIRRICKKK